MLHPTKFDKNLDQLMAGSIDTSVAHIGDAMVRRFSPASIVKAEALMRRQFGLGADAADQHIRTDPITKRLYDCAIFALAELIDAKETTTVTKIPSPVTRLTKGYACQKTQGTTMVDLVDRANGHVICGTVYEPYADQILAALRVYFDAG